MIRANFRWVSLAFVIGLSFYIFFYNLGGTSAYKGSEYKHALVSRCILERGQIYPLCSRSFATQETHIYCGGKEPLKFWLEALLFKFFSINEWTIRIIDALMGMATIILLLTMGRALLGWETGALAALMVLAFPPIIISHGFRTGNQDSLLIFFYTAAVLGYTWHRMRGGKGALLMATLAVIGGLMTKDVFLLSIYPSIALAEVLVFPGKKGLKHLLSPSFLIFLLVPLAWYFSWLLFVHFATGGLCIKHLLKREFVKPALGEVASKTRYYRGPLFYPQILIKYLGPLVVAPAAIFVLARQGPGNTGEKRIKTATFLLLVFLGYLILVSIPALKVKRYIYPIYPILALGVAFSVTSLVKMLPHRVLKAMLVAMVALFLGINLSYVSSKITKSKIIPAHRFLEHFRDLEPPKTFILEYPGIEKVDKPDGFYFSLIPKSQRMSPEEIREDLKTGELKGTLAIVTSHPDLYLKLPQLQVLKVWDMRKRKKEKLQYVVLEAKVVPELLKKASNTQAPTVDRTIMPLVKGLEKKGPSPNSPSKTEQ